MKEIHFVEREHVQGLTQVCPDRDEWESGDWSVRREKAFELIDREFYLHGRICPEATRKSVISSRNFRVLSRVRGRRYSSSTQLCSLGGI